MLVQCKKGKRSKLFMTGRNAVLINPKDETARVGVISALSTWAYDEFIGVQVEDGTIVIADMDNVYDLGTGKSGFNIFGGMNDGIDYTKVDKVVDEAGDELKVINEVYIQLEEGYVELIEPIVDDNVIIKDADGNIWPYLIKDCGHIRVRVVIEEKMGLITACKTINKNVMEGEALNKEAMDVIRKNREVK